MKIRDSKIKAKPKQKCHKQFQIRFQISYCLQAPSTMEASSFQRFKSYQHLLKVVLNACLSPFTYGYANGYFNSINIRDIANIYQVQGYSLSALQGVITGILPFTAGIGAYFTSYLLNKFSRRQTFQILATYTIFIHLLLMIPNIYVIFIARALQGLSIGIISAVTPLFIREFSPTELSGSLCPWNQIMNVVGLSFSFTLTFVLSLFLPVEIYWRICFGFPIITSLIQLYNLRYVYTFQTPKYLILQNREQQAKELLAIIYKDEYVNEVYSQIKKAIMAMALNNRFSVISNITEEDIPNYQRMSLRQSTRKRSFLNEQQMMEIKNQTLIRMTQLNLNLQTNPLAKITAIHLSIAQQAVGMGPIIAFSGQIVGVLFPFFEKFFPILISLVAVLGTFLCIPIMKATGRKLIIQFGSLFLGIMLIILSICLKNYNFEDFSSNSNFNKFTICMLFILIRVTFGFSTGPVVWIYISETVQQNFIPISTMINWMTVSAVTTFFPILNEKLGGNPTWIFMVFGIYTVLGVFATRSLMIETQGKNEFEINRQINQKWIEFKGK